MNLINIYIFTNGDINFDLNPFRSTFFWGLIDFHTRHYQDYKKKSGMHTVHGHFFFLNNSKTIAQISIPFTHAFRRSTCQGCTSLAMWGLV